MSSVTDLITRETVEVYWPEGCAPYTASVDLANAATHIAAGDSLAEEASLLLAIYHGNELPDGWKHLGEGEDADGDWCDVYGAN